MPNQPFDVRQAVFTPLEVSNAALKAVKERQTGTTRGLRFPVPELRAYCQDMLPGQLGVVIAQTSNFKTGFLDFWSAQTAEQLNEEERYDECVITVSLEDQIEDQAYAMMAREADVSPRDIADGKIQDWSLLEGAASRVGAIPIYRLGTALTRPDNYRYLYWTNIMKALDKLVAGDVTEKIRPAAIFIDYLQALPFDPEVQKTSMEYQRRLQVRNDIYRMKEAAFRYNCPVVCGVQGKQHLDGAPSKDFLTPGVYDGSEAQEIGQHPDRVYTLWMPKMTHSIGTEIEHRGAKFRVQEDMLWLKAAKQKPRLPSGACWMLQPDFNKNTLKLHPWMVALLQRQGGLPPSD